MRHHSFFVRAALAALCVMLVPAAYAQNTAEQVSRLDGVVKQLAGDVNRKLAAEQAGKITVGQFPFQNSLTSFGAYWVNQLNEELANIPNRSYTVLLGGASGIDYTITGEIVELTGFIRVYTRIIRADSRTMIAAFHTDLERNDSLNRMLSGGEHGSGRLFPDAWETDSRDNPVTVETGSGQNTGSFERNIHVDEDEDFFLLLPETDGLLVMETSGESDMLLDLYDGDGRESLASDDDSGSDLNARIEHRVTAGSRYLVKVRCYEGETGHYTFSAWFRENNR